MGSLTAKELKAKKMNRVVRPFRSFIPAFVFGLLVALLINHFEYFRPHESNAGATSNTDCDGAADAACSVQTGLKINSSLGAGKTSNIRIFCWIMVPYLMPLMGMIVINESWGHRCDGFGFVTSRTALGDRHFPVIDVNATTFVFSEFPAIEWRRIWLSAWQLHADRAFQQYDYFLLARTGNYVIIENLRRFLQGRDPNELFVTGRRMRDRFNNGSDYLAADAGIVLSNAAFVTMVTSGFSGTSSNSETRRYCGSDMVTKSYETQLSACLRNLGIKILDSRDNQGRERFHPVKPGSLLEDGRMPAWLRTNSYYGPVRACLSCPSPDSVTFFDIQEIKKTDAMIYHVGPSLQGYKATI